jgi:hypothetical protein
LATFVSAEEKVEWRTMYFSAPSIGYSISIQNGVLSLNKNEGYSWNGKIRPKIFEKEFSTRSSLPYFEDCSLELCNYAYSITGQDRASTVSKEDMKGFLHPEKIKTPKYIFSVSNNISNPDATAYEGYITEEEFTKLLTLALRDIKNISPDTAKTKTAATEETTKDRLRKEREAMFEKKLKALTEKK